MFRFYITVIAVVLYPILPILVYIRLLWRGRGSKQSSSSLCDESGNICQLFNTRDFISLKTFKTSIFGNFKTIFGL